MSKRIESPADTSAGFWGKSDQQPTSARAHLWRRHSAYGYSRSSCGLIYWSDTLRAADVRFPGCLNCEALERGKAGK